MSYVLVSERIYTISGMFAHEAGLIYFSLDFLQIIPLRIGLLHPGKRILYTFLDRLRFFVKRQDVYRRLRYPGVEPVE